MRGTCASCGTELSATAKFCPECATPTGLAPAGYTPRHLKDTILGPSGATETERKQVTVLFVDVSGFTSLSAGLDPEDVHQFMSRAFEVMLAEVHRYEGTVNQFLGDGIMALFGAPVALEHHALNAVQAALAIRQALEGYREELRRTRGIDFQVRQGLNTGLVVVGQIGDALRADYTAAGDTTNLAARLQQAANPGAVVIAEATFRLVEEHVHTRPLGDLALKGRLESLAAWEVIAPRGIRTRFEVEAERGFTPFVGRDRELGLLADAFEKAKAGQGHAVFVVGEPGVGKSRLLHEFRQRIGETAAWVEAHCTAFSRAIPFFPVIELLKRAVRIDSADAEETIVKKLDRGVLALGADLEPVIPHLRAMLAVEREHAALTRMDPKQRRAELFAALRQLTLRAAEIEPQVIVLEDLHWMDRATEEYVLHMSDSLAAARVLLVCTYRPEYGSPFGDRPQCVHIPLETLSTDETTRMTGALLASAGLGRDLEPMIVSKAEGNPFFVEEVVRAFRDVGAAGRSRFAVPDAIQDVITARIDRLDPAAKKTLQAASVLGRQFGDRILRRTLEAAEGIEPHLDALKRLEFIHEHGAFPEVEYSFTHALTQEVAYEGLLVKRRRDLHAIVARTIEALYAERLEEHYGALAYHCVRADAPAKAAEYLLKAGDRAVRLYANAEARAYYATALEESRKQPESPARAAQHIDIVLRLCPVAGSSADYRSDLENLQQALALADGLGERARESEIHYWIGRTQYVLGDLTAAIASAEQALAVADALADERLAALPLNLVGRLSFATSNFRKAWPILARSAAQFGQLGNRVEAATMTAGLGWSLGMLGEFERARQAAARGVAIAEETGHIPTLATCLQYRACSHAPRGEWEQAIADIRAARELAERSNDPFRLYMTTGLLGGFLVASGQRADGVALLEEAFEAATRLGTKLFLGVFRVYRAEAALAGGAIEEALAQCERALALAAEQHDRWSESCTRRVLGCGLAASEPPLLEDAERELREAVRIQDELGTRPDLARSLVELGRVVRRRGDHDEAAALIARACAMFKEMGMLRELAVAEAEA